MPENSYDTSNDDDERDKMRQAASDYSADHIQVLEGLTAVRKRPSMYIGSTDERGLHHLVYEVVDNSIDEAMAGFCDRIEVTIEKEGSVVVSDNGRGIPVDIHPKHGRSALEIVMTKLHAGGKFDKDSYKVSGGLHGVGVSVVNALSEKMEVKVFRNGEIFSQRYRRGIPVEDVKVVGFTDTTGTMVRFKPDGEIFETLDFDYDTLFVRLREMAFLNRGLRISLVDLRTDRQEVFRYEGGIIEFVKFINRNRTALHEDVLYFSGEREGNMVELAVQYNDGYIENTLSFVNNIQTPE